MQSESQEAPTHEELLLRQNKYLEALHKTTLGLIDQLDPTDLLKDILVSAGELCGAAHGYLYLLMPDAQKIEIRVATGALSQDVGIQKGPGEGLAGRIWQTAKPMIVEDYDTWEGRPPEYPYGILHAAMGAPLTSGDQVIGVIGIAHTEPGERFDQAQLEVLSQFAELASLALGNARLYETIQHELEERKRAEEAEREQRIFAEALLNTTAAINSTLSLDEVLDNILINVGKVVPTMATNIMMIDEQGEYAHIVRARGYQGLGLKDAAYDLSFRIQDMSNLRYMMQTGQPVVVADTEADPNWINLPELHWLRSYASAPIIIRERVVGFLNLDSNVAGFFDDRHARRLKAFADQAAVAIQNANLYMEIQQLAIEDEITGLYNRRGLFELGQREIERARRFNRPLAAIFLDVDHFKVVNDTFGHAVGDQVLHILATRLRTGIREIDIIGRYGGEEVVILLPENDLHAALHIAERLRRLIGDAPLETGRGPIPITISLGVVQMDQGDKDLAALINRADHAMYFAKQLGRNRIYPEQASKLEA